MKLFVGRSRSFSGASFDRVYVCCNGLIRLMAWANLVVVHAI